MVTSLLLALQFAQSLWGRVKTKRWNIPALPVYGLTGLTIAFAMILTWAHWPAPSKPLNIDDLLLAQAKGSPSLNFDEDNPVTYEAYIPPELFPTGKTVTEPQVVTSIQTSPEMPGNQTIATLLFKSPDSLKDNDKSSSPPSIKGTYHTIQRGETIWDIARAYGVSRNLVQNYNPQVDPRRIQIGQKIFIPGADAPILIPRKSMMISPLRSAWVISGFGYRKHPLGGSLRFHRGIDMPAPTGTPVRAVMAGVVSEVGYQKYLLGRLVKIKHSNGFETVYGHNSKILVKVGDRVEEGRVISRVGNTGRSTASHLHFGVIKNGKYVDPESYLPKISHRRPLKRYARH